LIDPGAAHERDEHVLGALDRMPHDVFTDLLPLRIQAGDTIDDRRP
jgi:hypothetical protein